MADENTPEVDDLALETLARAYASAPPPELRDRVLARVREEQREATERSLSRWRQVSVASMAAAATLAGFVLLGGGASSNLEADLLGALQQRGELQTRIDQQETDLRLLEDALKVHSEVVRILTSPDFRTASLRSRDGGEGTARVLMDPTSGAVAVLGKGLPPPKTGRVYELWAIRNDGKTERAGTLEPRGERSFAVRLREVAQPGQVREFAISVEPQGGAEKPSGPMVLVGSVR